MNLEDATENDINEKAKELVYEAGLEWTELSDEEKLDWVIDASFCFSWFC
jgi:hypothetical protein